jgi:hypothetical protein
MFYSPNLYSESRQLPPPSKDFVAVELTKEKLIIHHFRISPSNLRTQNASSSNTTYRAGVNEFLEYGDLEDKILDYFGSQTLQILRERANGKIDFINRLSDQTKMEMAARLPLELIPLIRK